MAVEGLFTVCPACKVELPAEVIGHSRYKCLNCGATLQRMRSKGYHWVRIIVCWSAAFALAWSRGWHDASVVFVIGFYFAPVAFAYAPIFWLPYTWSPLLAA